MFNYWEYDENEKLWYHRCCDIYADQETGLCWCGARYPGFWGDYRKKYINQKKIWLSELERSRILVKRRRAVTWQEISKED